MKVSLLKILGSLGLDGSQLGGFFDFIIGCILAIMPWLFVNDHNMRSLTAIMALGSALILYSIFTDYRHGIIRLLSKKIHEVLDLTIGVTLMALWPVKFTITGFMMFSLIIILLTSLHLL